ncbi:MAG TPA: tyrosine-type recombinase/integrase [Candidatus Hydrogenedentes bacterium]|nr:tyrosine-type recombinase/integrase [Candidatus Hydrogenedentota bacterium]HOV74835.1 tyrosine-type recombinase/integrase [Candidatus Hydrogenedentota bacterium]
MKKTQQATPARLPKFRIHKATGQGYVELNRRRVYLGKADNPATLQAYHAKVAEWLASGCQAAAPASAITISEVAAEYLKHATVYFRRKDGTPTSQITIVQRVLKDWVGLYGSIAASDFGPLKLRALRETWIARGLARKTVNTYCAQVKHIFKWAAGREIVPVAAWNVLQCVEGLRAGRSAARETAPVLPVPLDHVEAVKPFVSRQVAAMIDLQILSGARSGEIVNLRPCDIDTSGDVWTAKIAEHKTAHHGRVRILHFGPRAQGILRPFMLRPEAAGLFSPREAEQERRSQCPTHRHQPVLPAKTDRTLGDCYTAASYRRAVSVGCRKAGVPMWHPHQLRHNAASTARARFGLDAAQALLGHAGAAVTELYAQIDEEKVKSIVAQIG